MQALSQFSKWETVSKSKPLKLHWKGMTCNSSYLAIFFTTLKKRREDKKRASHCGSTKWSPAELWQSGNPWQCDFCLLLCIKSRCQEPSPPQPWLNPPSTSSPVILKALDDHIHGSFWANVTWNKEEVWVKQKIYTRPWHIESLCTWNHSYTPLEWGLILQIFVPKTTLNNFTFVSYEKWPCRLSLLHSSAEWGRCEAEQKHAAPATWSV